MPRVRPRKLKQLHAALSVSSGEFHSPLQRYTVLRAPTHSLLAGRRARAKSFISRPRRFVAIVRCAASLPVGDPARELPSVYLSLPDWEEAQRALEQRLRTERHSTNDLFDLAAFFEGTDRSSHALACLEALRPRVQRWRDWDEWMALEMRLARMELQLEEVADRAVPRLRALVDALAEVRHATASDLVDVQLALANALSLRAPDSSPDWEEAAGLYRHLVSLNDNLAPDSFDGVLLESARHLRDVDEQEALGLYERLLALRQAYWPEDGVRLSTAWCELGKVLHSLDQLERAKTALERAVEIAHAYKDCTQRDIDGCTSSLAQLWAETEPARSIAWFGENLSRTLAVSGPSARWTALNRYHLATALKQAGQTDEALRELEQMVAEFTESVGTSHPLTREAAEDLALLRSRRA
ncbi:MAG: hypothetical protein RL653_130 [Pseudomonadota bacterium]|jgi:tetratricopeptide (TPR) repeat protein